MPVPINSTVVSKWATTSFLPLPGLCLCLYLYLCWCCACDCAALCMCIRVVVCIVESSTLIPCSDLLYSTICSYPVASAQGELFEQFSLPGACCTVHFVVWRVEFYSCQSLHSQPIVIFLHTLLLHSHTLLSSQLEPLRRGLCSGEFELIQYHNLRANCAFAPVACRLTFFF